MLTAQLTLPITSHKLVQKRQGGTVAVPVTLGGDNIEAPDLQRVLGILSRGIEDPLLEELECMCSDEGSRASLL